MGSIVSLSLSILEYVSPLFFISFNHKNVSSLSFGLHILCRNAKNHSNNCSCIFESESHSLMSYSFWSHGLYSPWNFQARILKWVAFPFSRGSSWPRNQTRVSWIAGGFFINWAIREAPSIFSVFFFLCDFWHFY